MNMAEIKMEIVSHLGVLSQNERTGWTKELNITKVNNKDPKYDIRDWSPEHDKMSKGVRLTEEELQELKTLL